MASISVTRGDTLPVLVNIMSGYGPYQLKPDDEVTFSVKKSTDIGERAVITKVMTAETGLYCELTPKDTNIPYGKYKYDVELKQGSGDNLRIFTIIKPTTFTVTEEVTTHD